MKTGTVYDIMLYTFAGGLWFNSQSVHILFSAHLYHELHEVTPKPGQVDPGFAVPCDVAPMRQCGGSVGHVTDRAEQGWFPGYLDTDRPRMKTLSSRLCCSSIAFHSTDHLTYFVDRTSYCPTIILRSHLLDGLCIAVTMLG